MKARLSACTLAGLLLAGLLLAACTTSSSPPPTMASAAPVGAADSTAGAASCTSALANFMKVVDADAASGNLNQSVFKRISSDLATPKATCAAGKDSESRNQLAAIRARYGYP
ncbi:MAG: hypothetical protein B7Y12_19000 [Rhizobiales bacterium 24-66-13]|jgi:membrane-bound lytic murein transglycosylase B|nr:MAG: hypothetical protein B7Y61_12395 [Rhizobiales bacterium 35-66-30]OYZ69720.1 MAG: hypothetical protein B7Y12_19000 [Rhizobiales bacterium 24-66-13]OZB04057.1 MAG: hypothetical protein B7X67_15270 [Rhizobiales bacterium 39-66-18]HQS08016.1 hypothetical protein [Xanthobacteraceae bacterium]HQS49220.1 hypothetical protein [Xanthobacteraceae bacterium]